MANYFSGAVWNGQPGNVTTVGSAGVLSESFYGTSDQCGSVWEWNATVVLASTSRGLRGGTWFAAENDLRSSHQGSLDPANEGSSFGFRVASPGFSADLDSDGDVDLLDFGLFQVQFMGPQ